MWLEWWSISAYLIYILCDSWFHLSAEQTVKQMHFLSLAIAWTVQSVNRCNAVMWKSYFDGLYLNLVHHDLWFLCRSHKYFTMFLCCVWDEVSTSLSATSKNTHTCVYIHTHTYNTGIIWSPINMILCLFPLPCKYIASDDHVILLEISGGGCNH